MEMKVLGTINRGQVAEFMSQVEQLVKSYSTTIRPKKDVADIAIGVKIYEVPEPGKLKTKATPAIPADPKSGTPATPAIPVAKGRGKKDEKE